MKFSLIISTRGRTYELSHLFRSLKDQTLQDFEIIISDQNDDDRLLPIIQESGFKERLIHIKTTGGASRGRNQGMVKASGDFLTFPDDDCAYPPNLLEQVAEFFEKHSQYGYLSCRAFSDDGQDSVARYAKRASEITKLNIHAQCVEFGLFFRCPLVGGLNFDEQMGVGAPTPWHSDEGPDLLLRLEKMGVCGYYDPQFAIWHPQPVTCYDAKVIDRTYRYACGNGYFYRKHRYPFWFFAYQMGRTLSGLVLALAMLNFGKARVYLARMRGRWRGWNSNPPATDYSLTRLY
jgi:glycosyltransferase involved in cell wall biosynthesis